MSASLSSSDPMSSTPQGVDDSSMENVVVTSDPKALAALCTSDVPITQLLALLKTNPRLLAGAADIGSSTNVEELQRGIWSWDKLWASVGVVNVPPTLLIDEPEAQDAKPALFEFAAGPAGTALSVIGLVPKIVEGIFAIIKNDKKRRADFTRRTVEQLYKQNPHFNYVICHTAHTVNFQGTAGVDYSHSTITFPVWLHLGSVKFDLYVCKNGAFTLRGDGGFINWAYYGTVRNDTGGRPPRTVLFQAP